MGVSVHPADPLDPAVRGYLEATFREMTDKLWDLGDVGTRDGLDCNIGRQEACRLNRLAARPMTEVRSTPEERQRLRQIFQQTVLPGWVSRCGAATSTPTITRRSSGWSTPRSCRRRPTAIPD